MDIRSPSECEWPQKFLLPLIVPPEEGFSWELQPGKVAFLTSPALFSCRNGRGFLSGRIQSWGQSYLSCVLGRSTPSGGGACFQLAQVWDTLGGGLTCILTHILSVWSPQHSTSWVMHVVWKGIWSIISTAFFNTELYIRTSYNNRLISFFIKDTSSNLIDNHMCAFYI